MLGNGARKVQVGDVTLFGSGRCFTIPPQRLCVREEISFNGFFTMVQTYMKKTSGNSSNVETCVLDY